MCALQGKGIWTLYDDIDLAVARAPEVGAKYILCKVSKRGKYDAESASIALAKIHQNPDLIPVAWTFTYLENIDAEVECARCALADGFEAFIIDAEAETNNKFAKADEYAQKILAAGLDTSRIYLCSDPRLDTKIDEIPCTSLAKICQGGFMPMIYGEIMPGSRQEAAEKVMKAAYEQFARHQSALGYTIPLMPVVATYWDNAGKARMNYREFKKWCTQAQNQVPTFVSLYRAGVTSPEAWRAFKELEVSSSVVVDNVAYVQPTGPGYAETFYPPHLPGSGWNMFIDNSGHITRYRPTARGQTMYATYVPTLLEAGRYVVEVFIPGIHATTKSAHYFMVHHPAGQRQETLRVIDQLSYRDEWAPIGTFDLDPAQPESGRVNLIDFTTDSQVKEIAFTTVRWRPVVQGAHGFDAPVGSADERLGTKIWPGFWNDANGYLRKYDMGYHTGADLNLNVPTHDLDRHAPVYAVADGEVTYARVVPTGSWAGLIVIRHASLPDGRPVFSRYGHVEDILVREGELVLRGQQIAKIGQFRGTKPNYHLHFDISLTNELDNDPTDWPGFRDDLVRKNYVDPRKFIEDHRP